MEKRIEKKGGELVTVHDEDKIIETKLNFMEERWDLDAEDYGYVEGDEFPREEIRKILVDDPGIFEEEISLFMERLERIANKYVNEFMVWNFDGKFIQTSDDDISGDILSRIDPQLSVGRWELYDEGNGFSLAAYERDSGTGREHMIIPKDPKYSIGELVEAFVPQDGHEEGVPATILEAIDYEDGYVYEIEYMVSGELGFADEWQLAGK